MAMHRPYIYQEIGGTKRSIAGAYAKRADGRIGFAVGPYDTARPLVIDPVLLYSTYLGGSGIDDAANSIAVDQSGQTFTSRAIPHRMISPCNTPSRQPPARGMTRL